MTSKNLILVALAKVGGGYDGGTVVVVGEDGLSFFLFLIYFRKLNNKNLKNR